MRANTLDVSELRRSEVIRGALDKLATKADGKPTAPKTITRRRATLHGALRYAVELELLPSNPLENLDWKAPESSDKVDPRLLPNRRTVDRILAKIEEFCPWLVAYFGCLYFALMRPAEARHLNKDNLINLPDEGWG